MHLWSQVNVYQLFWRMQFQRIYLQKLQKNVNLFYVAELAHCKNNKYIINLWKVVCFVRKHFSMASTLAIGDGANDVSMITSANVGVGIYGIEG